jgi:hypothetical protein
VGGGERVLHLKDKPREKEFAAKEEALCQILQMKEVELSAKMWDGSTGVEIGRLQAEIE